MNLIVQSKYCRFLFFKLYLTIFVLSYRNTGRAGKRIKIDFKEESSNSLPDEQNESQSLPPKENQNEPVFHDFDPDIDFLASI